MYLLGQSRVKAWVFPEQGGSGVPSYAPDKMVLRTPFKKERKEEMNK